MSLILNGFLGEYRSAKFILCAETVLKSHKIALKASSTGVDRLGVDRAELSKTELQALVPEAVLSNLLEGVDLQHSAVVCLPNGRDLLVERKSDGNHPLSRDPHTFRDDRLFIIACDDTYAPKQYFDFFRLPRIQVHVVPTTDGTSNAQAVLDRSCRAEQPVL